MDSKITEELKSTKSRLTSYQSNYLEKVLVYLEERNETILEVGLACFDSESKGGDLYLVLENSSTLVKNISICPEDDTFVSIIGKKDWRLDDLYKLEL